ncbi:RNA polymerase sigma factor [Candidatus Gracilibacteria bacterium]|nr:RNA polymerase sigma factor [Candidatus Gracilibacteria bacterium]
MTREITRDQIEKLVDRAKTGDEGSFEKIFEMFFDKIFRYVSFRVAEEESEDIVSDVFLKVVESLHSYHARPKVGFNAWIFRIAHNTLIDFYRRKKDFLGLEDEDSEDFFIQIPDENPLPHEMVNQILTNKRLYEILKKLPPLQREILELKYLEDMSNSEISEITGKNEGNIRVIQLRALREIRKMWEE